MTISDAKIKDESALVRRLTELTNPTGTDHTRTPWQRIKIRSVGYGIADQGGSPIGEFQREPDSDLALYFSNAHPAMIGLFNQIAGTFDFLALGVADEPTRRFLRERAETLRIYADIFAAMGDTGKARAQEQARLQAAPHTEYPPGVNPPSPATAWSVIEAYAIMAIIPPGMITASCRHYVAGAIGAALFKAHQRGQRGEPL
jgi:hypothetical protein